jgi:hypothetical protein
MYSVGLVQPTLLLVLMSDDSSEWVSTSPGSLGKTRRAFNRRSKLRSNLHHEQRQDEASDTSEVSDGLDSLAPDAVATVTLLKRKAAELKAYSSNIKRRRRAKTRRSHQPNAVSSGDGDDKVYTVTTGRSTTISRHAKHSRPLQYQPQAERKNRDAVSSSLRRPGASATARRQQQRQQRRAAGLVVASAVSDDDSSTPDAATSPDTADAARALEKFCRQHGTIATGGIITSKDKGAEKKVKKPAQHTKAARAQKKQDILCEPLMLAGLVRVINGCTNEGCDCKVDTQSLFEARTAVASMVSKEIQQWLLTLMNGWVEGFRYYIVDRRTACKKCFEQFHGYPVNSHLLLTNH